MNILNASTLITGSNRGIGLALAKEMAKRGGSLHLQMRTPDQAIHDEMIKLGASSVKIWRADLGTRDSVDEFLNQIKNERIDILVNNAGALTGGLIEDQSLDEIYAMFQVNLCSLVHLTKAILPGMLKRKSGKIINHSSVSAIMNFPCASTYAASKAAVLAFTNCLQLELSGTGVTTLSLVTPGIETRMFKEIEVKYGKNISTPTDSIPPEEYAKKICDAIEKDCTTLEPGGATGVGLFIARHFPKKFQQMALKKFRR